MEPLNEEQQKAVDEFKKIRETKKKGRPPKEFGPLLKIAATILKETQKLTNEDIAAELKVSPATVAKMLRDTSVHIDTADMDRVRETFASDIAQIVKKMLVATENDMYINRLASAKNTGLVQATTGLINAMSQLSGKPTSIVEVRDAAAEVAAKIKEIETLEAELKKSMDLKVI